MEFTFSPFGKLYFFIYGEKPRHRRNGPCIPSSLKLKTDEGKRQVIPFLLYFLDKEEKKWKNIVEYFLWTLRLKDVNFQFEYETSKSNLIKFCICTFVKRALFLIRYLGREDKDRDEPWDIFIIWKINTGADVIMSNFWGSFFYVSWAKYENIFILKIL